MTIVLILVVLLLGGFGYTMISVRSSPSVVTRTQSGLVAADSLTTGNTAQWTFDGAASQPGAKYTYSEDSQGLHIGVQPPASDTWSSSYAVSPNTNAFLLHAAVTLSYISVPDNGFNTGVYAQTTLGSSGFAG